MMFVRDIEPQTGRPAQPEAKFDNSPDGQHPDSIEDNKSQSHKDDVSF